MNFKIANGNQKHPQINAVSALLDNVEITHDHLLRRKISVFQPKSGFRVGTDAVFLASSIKENNGRILDMGAGVGGVSLCLAYRLDKVQIMAVEVDPLMSTLAKRNVATNGFDKRLCIMQNNISTLPLIMASSFDHVVSNPPYHHATGTKPKNRHRLLAHMGDGLTLEDWVKIAFWATKWRGRVSFICRADRGAELVHFFAKAGASEILQFPLWPRPKVPAGRVIVQARKITAGPGAVLPGLIVHNDDGGFTEAASRIMKGNGLHITHPARKV
ncbi:methyltransferase [Candidatus Puniceispirillum sp.]|nr:methyltransferase [Candidatus Puniceispirillum sp.]